MDVDEHETASSIVIKIAFAAKYFLNIDFYVDGFISKCLRSHL